jgi:hypothetical protein
MSRDILHRVIEAKVRLGSSMAQTPIEVWLPFKELLSAHIDSHDLGFTAFAKAHGLDPSGFSKIMRSQDRKLSIGKSAKVAQIFLSRLEQASAPLDKFESVANDESFSLTQELN